MLLQLSQFYPFCPPAPSTTHSLRQSPHHCSCPWVIHIVLRLPHFLYCTLHPHGYSVTTCLYFLIPSPLHPFSTSPFPCSNHLVTNFFSLAAFKSLSLSLTFGILIICLGVGPLASILFGTLCVHGLECLLPSPN